ncbi:DUF4019 domain-containing protein [Cognaticolwellia aestuarii]|uniref:DUF4019 domain-containing protein n=1 Tax=Cognaticolwellia aestuarii TaxID=329993 RepID=UPI0009871534|nr:DUF4019 domain-containing protein [Cognaticolwellia aestuarii]
MKKFILILALCSPAFVWVNPTLGTSAAQQWLNIVDTGKYNESWQSADAFFQTQLSQNKWHNALKSIRTPLGKVISRKELSSKEYSSLPGVPDGEYLVIQFQTQFQNKKSSTETLTLSKSSGQWLPVGYFIQ